VYPWRCAVQFFFSYLQVEPTCSRPVSFVLPTGAAGHLVSGLLAKLMGLPVSRLCAATNTNGRRESECTTRPGEKEGQERVESEGQAGGKREALSPAYGVRADVCSGAVVTVARHCVSLRHHGDSRYH
jgi:threonine synthase